MLRRLEVEINGKTKLFSFNESDGSLSCDFVDGDVLNNFPVIEKLKELGLLGDNDRFICNQVVKGGYSAPFKIYIDITDSCQLNCRHCLTKELNKGNELSVEKMKEIADECAELGVFYVKLGGGEPLLHRGFCTIVQYFKNKGIFLSVSTNGYLVDDDMADFLTVNKVKITVSVEGNRKIDEMIRGRGHFDIALRALDILKSHNANVALRVTLTRYMLRQDYFEDILEVAKQQAVPLKVSYCRPAGSSLDNGCMLLPEDYAKYLNIIEFLNKEKKNHPIILDEGMMYEQPGELEWLLYSGRICGATNRSMHINSKGQISPCVFMGPDFVEKESYYKKGDIAAYWREETGEKIGEVRRVQMPRKCAGCSRKCKFECLATRLYFTNDFLGDDPNCLFSRKEKKN